MSNKSICKRCVNYDICLKEDDLFPNPECFEPEKDSTNRKISRMEQEQ